MSLQTRACILVGLIVLTLLTPGRSAANTSLSGGALQQVDGDGKIIGECPLDRTDVKVDIVGLVSRVKVQQRFRNTSAQKIEAIYVFPLPHKAAVDAMVMTVGARQIIGQIKPRDEARETYETARAAGHIASLFEQERPNIFTQSVTNLEPGAQVEIEIRYTEILAYDDGVVTFVFPMVVGPRYMPGQVQGPLGSGWAEDPLYVTDTSRMSPPVVKPGQRAGHDIGITIRIDAGLPIYDVKSELHDIVIASASRSRSTVTLASKSEIPNKDFILHYRTATDTISDGLLVHTDEHGTFFTLLLQPPQRVTASQVIAKEMLFVLDRSGSMRGFPLDKAKEAMRLAIEQLNSNDTFNVLSFSDKTDRLFPKSVSNTVAHRATTLRYLNTLDSSGGTEMLSALREAFTSPTDPGRVRIVCFMTDGYVGNNFEILAAVREHAANARVFSFGIGNAVNRLLLDAIAYESRGEAHYVTLDSQARDTASRFVHRVGSPVLTDISLDWGTLPVSDVYPRQLPDLFNTTPIMVHGRLHGPATGIVTLRGRTAGGPFMRSIVFPATSQKYSYAVIPLLWARAKVEDLMAQDYAALQQRKFPEALQKEIVTLATQFHLLTQFTSFVAIEELIVTVGGEAKKINVPVELPSRVDYEGVFGQARTQGALGSLVGLVASLHGGSGGAATESKRMVALAAKHKDRQRNPYLEVSPDAETIDFKNDPQTDVMAKLATPLRALAATMVATKSGQTETSTVAGQPEGNPRIDVMVTLRNTSEATLTALKAIGFVVITESKITRLLVGSIAVSKLEALAQIDTVQRVTPVPRNG